MQALGFSEEDMSSIDRILAAILHLGNIQFVADEEGVGSLVSPEEEATQVARLLGMERVDVVRVLTSRILASQKERVVAKLAPFRAKFSRDALAKVCIEA